MPILDWIAENMPWTPIAQGIRAKQQNDFMQTYRQQMMDQQAAQAKQLQQQQGAAQQAWADPGTWQPTPQVPVTPQVGSEGYGQAQQQLQQTNIGGTGRPKLLDTVPQEQRAIWEAGAQMDPAGTLAKLVSEATLKPQEQWTPGIDPATGLPGQKSSVSGKFDYAPQKTAQPNEPGVTIREMNVGDEIRYGRIDKQGNFLGYVSDQGGKEIGGRRYKPDNAAVGPQGPFGGLSMEAQDTNILLNGDPGSDVFAAAYARQASPRVLPDGSKYTPDMRAYKKPTSAAFAGTGNGPAPRAAGEPTYSPGGLRAAKQMNETMGGLIKNTKEKFAEVTSADRAAYLTSGVTTPKMASALAAWNFVVSQLRDPSLLNTGVLQAGELAWINSFMQNPGTLSAFIQGDKPALATFDEIMVLLKAKQKGYEATAETPDSAPDARAAPQGSGGDQPPPGISPAEWAAMPPEDKALWQK